MQPKIVQAIVISTRFFLYVIRMFYSRNNFNRANFPMVSVTLTNIDQLKPHGTIAIFFSYFEQKKRA